VSFKSRPSFISIAVVVAAAAAGTAIVAQGAETGVFGLRGMRFFGLVIGLALCVGGVVLFQRAARRRARINALTALMPRYQSRRMEQDFPFGDFDPAVDFSDRLPIARSEIRDATRALLVSLEEEMQRETARQRRSGRPACRRARLRAAGRSPLGRRRVVPRATSIPS
jgi:hypothetical protein